MQTWTGHLFSHSKLLLRLISNEALNVCRKWYESDDVLWTATTKIFFSSFFVRTSVIHYNSVRAEIDFLLMWVYKCHLWHCLIAARPAHYYKCKPHFVRSQQGSAQFFWLQWKCHFWKSEHQQKWTELEYFGRRKPVVNFGNDCTNFNKLGLLDLTTIPMSTLKKLWLVQP